MLKAPKAAKSIIGRPRKQQLQIVRRKLRQFVNRNERLDGGAVASLIKKDGREVLYSWTVLEQIFALDVPKLTNLERQLEDWDHRWTTAEGKLDGHGSKIRNLQLRVEKLEQILNGLDEIVRDQHANKRR